jgi:two-component system CheB/CheR fusion protein
MDKGTQKNLTDSLLGEAAALFMPPTIITDKHDVVISIINNINPYTEIQPGRYANDLYALLPKDLGLFVSNLMRQVKSGRSRISRNVSNLAGSTKGNMVIEIRKMTWDGREYYLTSFQEEDKKADRKEGQSEGVSDQENMDLRVIDLEKELRNARENLAATIEELESANEELQSSNEELIASNEELQSTNEELQSVNEELYTVNTEHQQKIEELTQLNNDINNLLRNTEVAAIYLDNKLCIRKITPYATQITRIREGDIGRPVNHLSLMEGYKELPQDVERVIETLQPIDREITTQAGHSFFTRIRPYRTEHHAVDGILVTIIEITELDKLRRRADLAGRRLAQSLDMGQMAWWEYEQMQDRLTFSENLNALLDIHPKHLPGNLESLMQRIHPDDHKMFYDNMQVNSAMSDHAWDITLRLLVGDGTYRWFRCTGELKKQADQSLGPVIYGLLIDIKDLHILEEEVNRHAELLDLIMEHAPVSTVMVDGDGWITYANKQAEALFGITRQQITKRSYDASEWEITGPDGKPLASHDLPFSTIKSTQKSVKNFKHYIKIPLGERKLISIDGVPVVSNTGRFEGAVFSITQIEDERNTGPTP